MKKDIFGRELIIGSVVVVKATGRNSSGLKLGVVIDTDGKVVIFGPKNKKSYSATDTLKYNEYFLVEHPSESERAAADKMLQEHQRKRELKPLKMQDMQHLHVYQNKYGNEFVFCKNISFDIYLAFDDTLLDSFTFKNHCIQLQYSLYLDSLGLRRKGLPTIYNDTRKVTEQEIIDNLTKEYEYGTTKRRNERNLANIYEDYKYGSKVLSPKQYFEERKVEHNLKISNRVDNSSLSATDYYRRIGYTAKLYVDNVKIFE